MTQPFVVAPRYRLDDEFQWLRGIDPSRQYYLWINGECTFTTTLPGLLTTHLGEWQQAFRQFRKLQPQEQMTLERLGLPALDIHCLSANCYAIATTYQGADVWHLFDQEALESLLMTGHPDWQGDSHSVELGREILASTLSISLAA
ncbi:MAG: hypothetical protein F6J87_00495 [Spirulina sp. SIO3F2]|nr:hypothetical protein [Spirulina sp. SIO3F2]